ncbi:hypothetical protein HQ560_19795 [bacterium]|nr:hypothetical protein [bacterium]
MDLTARGGLICCVLCALSLVLVASSEGAALWVGSATVSITPDQPVALSGQFHTRIARSVDNPVTATALALESRDEGKSLDHAIMVSCDLVAIRGGIQDRFRQALEGKLPGVNVRKVFLSATHTHTAPVMVERWYAYDIPDQGVMRAPEFVEFLVERLCQVVVAAWEKRQAGAVSWTFGHAVVGRNRRALYENGTARMYGKTDTPDLRSLEGYEDHGVDMLFFWDKSKALTAVAINVACPSQEVEGRRTVNADFWHDVREQLRAKYGNALNVVAWCAPAGDQSPHLMYYKRAEERMRTLRGLTRTQELARRIVAAVDDTIGLARKDIRTDAPLVHQVHDVKLPARVVAESDVAEARARLDAIRKKEKAGGTLTSKERAALFRDPVILESFERQKTDATYPIEMHVLRLGDVAIATNPFELYLDYGVQIKARSQAVQTFLIQLACSSGIYLPTAKAIAGGHYSTSLHTAPVGPKGGKALVQRTVAAINALWRPSPKNPGGTR